MTLTKTCELYTDQTKTQTRTEDEIEIVTELRTKNINNKTWELKGNMIKLKREKTLGQEHKNFTKQK